MRDAAHLRAFALVEAVQSEDHRGALLQISTAEAEAAHWPEVLFTLAAARAINAIMREPDWVAEALARVRDLAVDDSARGVSEALNAVALAGLGDVADVLVSAGRAVALLERGQTPRERCFGLVVVAAALNSLQLWEIVDHLYALALEDEPSARDARQLEAIAVNRVVAGTEHALALLAQGDTEAAYNRLAVVRELVPFALEQDLRPLWRHDVEAVADVGRVLLGQPPRRPLAEHGALLRSENDVEVAPILEAVAAYSAWRDDGRTELAVGLDDRLSISSGSATFVAWVRATVLSAGDEGPGPAAQRALAKLLSGRVWQARGAVLSAARAQIAAARRRAEHERLSLAVHTDPLTGLLNRRRFDDWLQRPGTVSPAALVLLDIDGFKTVNDRFGHACGDEVLRRVGSLLRGAVRPQDLAVRQGGDEFALVFQGADLDPDSVQARAVEVTDAIAREDWERLAPGLSVRLSVGAALICRDGESVDGPELYRVADSALYRAKRERLPPVLTEL
jgi:diguanylate cyclase (GGDEF)-like protein